VLPDLKLGHPLDRAAYVRYWKELQTQLEEMHRELGLLLDPGTAHEIRLVQEFARSVDSILLFLKDILMPRQLDAHLDHGFPAVREALRRRLERS
jgi:hypothetical protein